MKENHLAALEGGWSVFDPGLAGVALRLSAIELLCHLARPAEASRLTAATTQGLARSDDWPDIRCDLLMTLRQHLWTFADWLPDGPLSKSSISPTELRRASLKQQCQLAPNRIDGVIQVAIGMSRSETVSEEKAAVTAGAA